MRFPDALAPLRQRRFAWFYASQVVSTAGTTMASVGLTFAVLAITDSAATLGLVLAARTVTLVAFLLLGGVLADRLPRTTVLVSSHLLSGLTQAVVAALVISGTATLPVLAGLEAVNGAVSAFTMPAMEGIFPQVAPRSHLQQANALLSFSRGGLAVLGPSLAALLAVSAGPGWALAVDAATWLVAAALLTRVRLPASGGSPARDTTAVPLTCGTPDAARTPGSAGVPEAGVPGSTDVPEAAGAGPGEQPSSPLRDLREGWAFFRGTTWLWVVTSGFVVINAIYAGGWYTLGPVVAKETFGIAGWGYVLSAEAVGFLVMTVVMLRVRLDRPLRTGMLAMLVSALPILMLGLRPQLGVLLVASFLAGVGGLVFSIGWSLALQENIEESMLSRASSYDLLGSYLAIPVGQVVFGPLGDAFGNRVVMVAGGIAYVVVVGLVLASRPVRDLRRARVPDRAVT